MLSWQTVCFADVFYFFIKPAPQTCRPGYMFCCVNFFLFLNSRQITSGSTKSIFVIFAPNDRYLFEDDRSGPFFWFLKGRCHGNQLKSKNRCFSWTVLIWRAAVRKRNAISQFWFQKDKMEWTSFFPLCTVLVTFGPVTSEFTLLTITPFCGDTAKISISHQMSQ